MNSSNHGLTTTQPAPTWVPGGVQRPNRITTVLEIPFIHKRLVVVCTLLGMLSGWVAILAWPRTYQSEAKLVIRVGRESVSLDPTATVGGTLMLQKAQEEEIISALEVLNSRQVAEAVVDKMGAGAILRGALPDAASAGSSSDENIVTTLKRSVGSSLYHALKRAGIKDDISDRELAVLKLQDSVGIHSPRGSSVIVVDAKAETPQMAQAIVNEVTHSFMDEHLRAALTRGSREFFEKQSADVENQLNQLVSQRSQFMKERKIVSIDSNRLLLQQQLSGIDRDFVVASGELEQAISEIADLESKVADSEVEIVAAKTQGSEPTWSGMRQRVYDLELEALRQAAVITPNHPKMKSVLEELDGAREILAKLKSDRVDESTIPNPTMIKLREEVQRQQTRVVGLRSIIQEKEQQRAEIERQIGELLEHERELIQQDRNIKLTDSSLQLLREKLEEARVIDELHSKKISNVHVFQPATFAERAISPKKPLLAAGFVCLGLTSGIGLSLLRQTSSPFLRTIEDVQFELGGPVVSSIPRLRRMDSLRLREQSLYREKCQALVAEILHNPGRPRQTRGRSVAIIGVNHGAGASTLAANLAVSSSIDCRMKTVLVDADSRQRTVSKMFGLNGTPGLVELVNGSASHDECLQQLPDVPVDLVASAADSCDDILTNSASAVVQALQAYLHGCDLMIVDLPAASEPDQVALAQHFDCVVVVVESEKTQTAAADRLLRRLSESNTEVIGVVLNKTRSYIPKVLQLLIAPQSNSHSI